MNSDPRIDSYIAKAAPFSRPILEHIRARVHAAVPEVDEDLKWGAPAFTLGGKILLIMAAFKAHAALNFWRGQEIGRGKPDNDAMGQFGRLTALSDLPPDEELEALVREAARLSTSAPLPRKPKHEPKSPAEIHPEFAAALDSSPRAKETLESFSPSARRDYVEWIAEAKQDSTRAKRIATSIAWLSDGKKRHWKYEKC